MPNGKFDNTQNIATRSLDSGHISKQHGHKRALSKNQETYNTEKLMAEYAKPQAIDSTNSRLSNDGKPNHNFLYN